MNDCKAPKKPPTNWKKERKIATTREKKLKVIETL